MEGLGNVILTIVWVIIIAAILVGVMIFYVGSKVKNPLEAKKSFGKIQVNSWLVMVSIPAFFVALLIALFYLLR